MIEPIQRLFDNVELEPVGRELSDALHQRIVENEGNLRQAVDLLHGTWLGHPLHAVLTDVTIGAWTFGLLLDSVGFITRVTGLRRVGGALNTIGILSAIPTALSDLADYSSIKQNAVKEGMLHAGTNSAAFVLHLLGWQARWRQKWFQGLIWSNLGTAVASVGAWLGGDLVYRLRVGVNYSDESANLDDWTAVATEKEIIDGTPLRVEIDDIPIMLIRDKDALHAMNATCAHAGGPLDEGTVDGHRVTCPWHDSVFNLCDGSVIHGPAVYPQPTYDVRIRNGHVEIRRPQLAHESDKA